MQFLAWRIVVSLSTILGKTVLVTDISIFLKTVFLNYLFVLLFYPYSVFNEHLLFVTRFLLSHR